MIKNNAYFCPYNYKHVKVHIKFISIARLTLFFISCNSKKSSEPNQIKTVDQKLIAEDIEEIKVDIKGMTCEIGCARLIQSKFYKAEGVSFAKVSFADSSGIVKFDQNRISQVVIKHIIERTAGGELYSVTSIEKVDPAVENNDIH